MIERAAHGDFELVVPLPVLAELDRVARDKLGFSETRRVQVRALLERIAPVTPAPARSIEAVTGDAADDVILACAVAAGAHVLVTGDRMHLVPLGEHCGVRILTPQAFLAELVGGVTSCRSL